MRLRLTPHRSHDTTTGDRVDNKIDDRPADRYDDGDVARDDDRTVADRQGAPRATAPVERPDMAAAAPMDSRHTLIATYKRFGAARGTSWAAALSYFGVLALFPAIIAVVSVLGIIGSSATQPLLDNIATLAPGPGQDILTNAINGVQTHPGASTLVFIFGLALAIWSASAYVSAFMNASNDIYGVGETRSIFKRVPLRVAVTVLLLTLAVLVTAALVVSGDLAHRAGDILGVGNSAVDVWDIAKIPVILLAVSGMFALLYWSAPNVGHERFRWVTPGSVCALAIWIVASIGFGFYAANFGSYNQTYGALGGAVIFLVWLWITNLALLFGAALNAELELRNSSLRLPTFERELAAARERSAERDRQQAMTDEDAPR